LPVTSTLALSRMTSAGRDFGSGVTGSGFGGLLAKSPSPRGRRLALRFVYVVRLGIGDSSYGFLPLA